VHPACALPPPPPPSPAGATSGSLYAGASSAARQPPALWTSRSRETEDGMPLLLQGARVQPIPDCGPPMAGEKSSWGLPPFGRGWGPWRGEEQDKRWFYETRERPRKRREVVTEFINLKPPEQKRRTETLARFTRHLFNLFDKYNRI